MSFYKSKLIEEKNLVKTYECILDGFTIGKETEAKLQELQANAHLKGFRKGKTPMNVIQQNYFNQTFFDIINAKANACIAEIAKADNLELASSPKVELDPESSIPAERNTANVKDVTMKVIYEVLPKVEPIDFKKLKVEKYALSLTEEDIKEELDRLAKGHALKEEKDSPIEDGDIAIIDFLGTKNGTPFKGGESKDYELVIGSKSFIEGFEEGLIGLKAKDTKTLDLKFPEQYHEKDLSGQAVQFVVTIKKVLKQTPHAIDDELAKKFSFQNLEELKEDIKKNLVANYESAYKNKNKTAVFDGIKTLLEFDVPPSMQPVEEKTPSKEEASQEGEESQVSAENKPSTEEKLQGIRLSIFLMNYAKENKIDVSQKDFMEYITSLGQMYGQSPQTLFDVYEKNEKMKESVYNLLFENKIYDDIFAKIPTEAKQISKKEFDEILK